MIVTLMLRNSVVVVGLIAAASSSLHGQEIATMAMAVIPAMLAQSATMPRSRNSFTAAERFSYYVHRTYSPHRLFVLGIETGIDHALSQPTCWDQGAGSYATRYARALDRRMIRNTAEFGAGLLTGEDLRYRPLASGRLRGRVWHAVRAAFVARMPGGGERPAYTRFAASAVVEVGTAHWTGQRITAGWLAGVLGSGALDQIETNLLDEFAPDIRRLGRQLRRSMAAGVP
jgi:hypothetical protein